MIINLFFVRFIMADFVPSEELVALVLDSILRKPRDREFELLIEKLGLHEVSLEERRENVKIMVTDGIRGMFTQAAKRNYRTNKGYSLALNGRFSSDACEEVQYRFGLEIPEDQPTLDRLFMEVTEYFSRYDYEEIWGKARLATDGRVEFTFSGDDFKIFDFSKTFERGRTK